MDTINNVDKLLISMCSDFKGLIGSAISDIDTFELEPGEEVKRLEEGN